MLSHGWGLSSIQFLWSGILILRHWGAISLYHKPSNFVQIYIKFSDVKDIGCDLSKTWLKKFRLFLWSLLLNNKVGKLSLFSNWLRENAISGECSTRNVASGMGLDISGCYAAKNDDVLKWSPSGPHVFPKWPTCDLSVSYLISLKHLLFENIAHDGPGCTWLYPAVPGCILLCLHLPLSTLP